MSTLAIELRYNTLVLGNRKALESNLTALKIV